MTPVWRTGEVQLRDSYHLLDAAGRPVQRVRSAGLAIEGGFVHVQVPGVDAVQVVSAPAVQRLSYDHPAQPGPDPTAPDGPPPA